MDQDEDYESNWSQADDSDQDISTHESESGDERWNGDVHSESDAEEEPDGEEFDPEPPDDYSISQRSFSESEEEADERDEEEYESEGDLEEEDSPEDEPELGELTHEGEHDQAMETCHRPWDEETDSQISIEEDEQYEDEFVNHEAEPEDNYSDNTEFQDGESESEEEHYAEQYESSENPTDDEVDSEPRHISFSGHDQGSKAYLRWEKDMDEWFHSNQIKEEERTLIAEETLTDEAFLHWDRDAELRLRYEQPDHTWEEMKQLLHQEFVEETETEPYYPRPLVPNEPRRWITVAPSKKVSSLKTKRKTSNIRKGRSKEKPEESAKRKPRVSKVKEEPPKAEQVEQSAKKPQEEINISSSITLQNRPAAPHQGKCSKTDKIKDTTCYRCHKRGHFAVNCPTKKVLKETSLENEIALSKTSDSLVQIDLLHLNSSITPLSLSKGFVTGFEEIGKGEKLQILVQLAEANNVRTSIPRSILTITSSDMMHLFLPTGLYTGLAVVPAATITFKSKTGQSTRGKESIKEKPPNPTKNIEHVRQVSLSLTPFVSHDATYVLKSLLNIQEYEETICLRLQKENNCAKASIAELDSTSLNFHKESIMHLFLAQSVVIPTGIKKISRKEVPPDKNLLLGQDQNKKSPQSAMNETKTHKVVKATKVDQLQGSHDTPGWRRGVILSYLLKGEPPDAPHLTKQQTYQGKTLNSQNRMNANLLSLGAENIVSRTKPFQEGEYDEDIKSSSTKYHGIWRAMKGNDVVLQVGPLQEKAQEDQRLLNGGFRPGEASNHKEDILNQLEESYITYPYTSSHRIRRILLHPNLPYLGVFTLSAINPKRLYLCYICNLFMDLMNQDVPRHHKFMPKLSRYKEPSNFPYLADFVNQTFNG